MSNKYGPRIVTDGLVLCLDAADKNSYPAVNTYLYDLTGNGYTGTLLNGVGFSSDNGGVFTFDGSNDYLDITVDSLMPINTFTVMGWFKHSGTVYKTFIAYVSGSQGWNLLNKPNRALNVRTDTSSVSNGYVADGGTVGDGNWHYICLSIEELSGPILRRKLFLDGKYQSQGNISGNFNNTGRGSVHTLRVMGPGLGTAYTAGSSSCVSLYNRTLSTDEILQNYNATKGRFGL